MKIKILFASFFLWLAVSCQKEFTQIITDNQKESLQANVTATNYIRRIVAHNGSVDDIIDNANCILIKLPVSVIANGVEIVINSEADYALIQQNFEDLNGENLQINYPIVLILSDYSEVTVSNENELKVYAEKCKEDSSINDEIECLNFVYPIYLSVYDVNNQFAETIEASNDKFFYEYLQQLNATNIVAINFPISVRLYTGETRVISSMNELETFINSVKDACD